MKTYAFNVERADPDHIDTNGQYIVDGHYLDGLNRLVKDGPARELLNNLMADFIEATPNHDILPE